MAIGFPGSALRGVVRRSQPTAAAPRGQDSAYVARHPDARGETSGIPLPACVAGDGASTEFFALPLLQLSASARIAGGARAAPGGRSLRRLLSLPCDLQSLPRGPSMRACSCRRVRLGAPLLWLSTCFLPDDASAPCEERCAAAAEASQTLYSFPSLGGPRIWKASGDFFRRLGAPPSSDQDGRALRGRYWGARPHVDSLRALSGRTAVAPGAINELGQGLGRRDERLLEGDRRATQAHNPTVEGSNPPPATESLRGVSPKRAASVPHDGRRRIRWWPRWLLSRSVSPASAHGSRFSRLSRWWGRRHAGRRSRRM
jgi:hypothetical protein